MSQPALFHESIVDALRELVAQMGGTKAVGARMRPELPADHAGRWLADCLNGNRREHLAPEQLMWLLREGRQIGAHGAMGWIAGEAGYTSPQPLEPDDERSQLQREYIEAAKHMAKVAERIERVAAIQIRAAA